MTDFVGAFNFRDVVKTVEVDLSKAHIWDESGVAAIDKIVMKFHENDIKTTIIGLNAASKSIVDSIAIFNKPNGINENIGH